MAEIHGFSPEGQPSPGAEKALSRYASQVRGIPSRSSVSWGRVGTNPYSVVRVFDAIRPGVITKTFGHGFERQGVTGADLKPEAESLPDILSRTGYGLAVNADGWRIYGNIGEVRGPQIIDGEIYHDFGNPGESPQGVEAFGIKEDGTYSSYSALDGDTANSMVADGVVTSFSYGPQCVRGGQVRDISDTLWSQFHTTKSARQIIGFDDNGALVIITVTGVSGSTGISGVECGPLALQEGAQDAWIMDGGGSAQTAASYGYVMPSSDQGAERPVPSAMLVNSLSPSGRVSSPWFPLSLTNSAVMATTTPRFRLSGGEIEFLGEIRMADGSPVPGTAVEVLKAPFRPVNQGIAVTASAGVVTGKATYTTAGIVNIFGDGTTTPYVRLEGLGAPMGEYNV